MRRIGQWTFKHMCTMREKSIGHSMATAAISVVYNLKRYIRIE